MAVSSEEIVASAASIEPPKWVGAGLWASALLTWGLADLATTWYGMEHVGTYEDMALAAAVIEQGGHVGHAAFKLAVFGIAAVYYREAPEVIEGGEWVRLAIPLAFVIAGTALALRNVAHIVAAAGG